jgi:hypothetical protein
MSENLTTTLFVNEYGVPGQASEFGAEVIERAGWSLSFKKGLQILFCTLMEALQTSFCLTWQPTHRKFSNFHYKTTVSSVCMSHKSKRKN